MTDQEEKITTERVNDYVGSLLELARREDRGALAALRRGLGQPPGSVAQTHGFVAGYLTDDEAGKYFRQSGQWFYVIGALFALHPKLSDSSRSLGDSLARLKSDSMDLRLTALLNADPTELPDQLRRVVALLKANEIAINWFRLLKDLLYWTHPDRPVQRRWAHHYYSAKAKENA